MEANLIFLSLLFFLIYFWSKEYLGGYWAFLPALLTVGAPQFVGGNPLPTLGFALAVFTFFNFLFHPSRLNLLLSGLALGAVQIVTPTAALLFFYEGGMIVIFYFLGLVRDWQLTAAKDRFYRFQTRAIRYARAFFLICLLGLLTFYSTHFLKDLLAGRGIAEAFGNAYRLLKDYFVQWPGWEANSDPVITFFSQSWPILVLVFFAVIFTVMNFFRQPRKFDFLQYLTAHFVQISLIIFIAVQLMVNDATAPLLPFLFVLLAQPIRNFIMTANDKEVMIMVAHEGIRFSAKWLLLAVFIVWYAINTLVLYF